MPTIDIRVELSESVGRHQLVYGTAGEDRIVARVDSFVRVGHGDCMRLGVDPGLLHLFDGRTGLAVI